MKNLVSLFIAGILILGVCSFSAIAAERMKYEDYQAQLKAYQDREATARAAIEVAKKGIEELKAKLAELDLAIKAIQDEIYAFLGTDHAGYEAFLKRIEDLEKQVDELAKLTPEQLLERMKELDALAAQVAAMLKDPIAKIKQVKERLQALEARIERLKASIPKPKMDLYSVLRGDYLWKIAKKPDIYADPWKWLRIWSANKATIKDPDLIYPDQRLSIPRQIGKDEYLVKKGDNLKRISGMAEVYGDPFKWTKIYQANKSGQFLNNPNIIYPEMILAIPRN